MKFPPPIQQLNRRLLRMNRHVSKAVIDAVQSLSTQNENLAGQIITGDDRIDSEDVAFEQHAIDLLTGSPGLSPKEFRYILCLLKINSDLERIADCAVNIAERVPTFVQREAPALPDDLRIMANSACGMLRDAVNSWVAQDPDAANAVLRADDVVDAMYDQLADDLGRKLSIGGDSTRHYLEYLMAARDFERIADHATNIAECVLHSATGRIARHKGKTR